MCDTNLATVYLRNLRGMFLGGVTFRSGDLWKTEIINFKARVGVQLTGPCTNREVNVERR